MKVAVVGSRSLIIENIESYLPKNVSELVSGGAKGIDSTIKEYAKNNNIFITEFLPNYQRYNKGAPLKRNQEIVNYADEVVVLWDGKSKGSKFVIDYCNKINKKLS